MPKFTRQTPYVEVFDMIESVAFYRDILGYEVVFASPEVETKEGRFSHFMLLRRDKIEIMLNTAYDSNERPPQRSDPRWRSTGHYHLYIDCDDVSGLHHELQSRGLRSRPPAQTDYGFLSFSVRDPDGYRVTFHQPI